MWRYHVSLGISLVLLKQTGFIILVILQRPEVSFFEVFIFFALA